MKVTGYVVGMEDRGGTVAVQIAELPNARLTHRPGKVTLAHLEDPGLKLLLGFFGGSHNLTLHAGATRLVFYIDGGLIKGFTPAEEN